MIKILLKFIFASGIIYWLVAQGKLDFNLVSKALNNKLNILIAFIFLAAQASLAAYRWKKILAINASKKIKNLEIIRLTWIGLFFSSVLPGAVTGDLIKLVYARDLDRSMPKTFLVMSVLMDRILGLIGLLVLLGICSIFAYEELSSKSEVLQNLIHFNFLLFIGVLVFLFSLFLNKKYQQLILGITTKIPLLGEKITKTLEQVWIIGADKKTVLYAIFISLFCHTFNIVAFYTLSSPFYDQPISFLHAFTFMPLGFMAIAVPISPAGLGVGHAIFNTLFKFFGTEGGASLFNLHFIAYVSLNLFGVFPYLLAGKRHTLNEASEFEHLSESKN